MKDIRLKSIYFKNSIYLLLSGIVVFHFFTCEKELTEPEPVYSEISLISPEDSTIIYNTDSLLLKWNCPNASSFDVYFDTLIIPEKTIAENRIENSLQLVGLQHNKVYFWKVIAKFNDGKKVEGDVWKFITADFDSIHHPHDPIPDNGSITHAYSMWLKWQCPDYYNWTWYIYLDTENPPVNKVGQFTGFPNFFITGLRENTNYYWQIDATFRNGDKAKGQVWSFHNADYDSSYYPHNSLPANGAIKQPLTLLLSWECENGSFYKVYIDTLNPPQILINTISNKYLQIQGLENSTQYFWKVEATLQNGSPTESPIWNFNTKDKYSDLYFDMNDAFLLLQDNSTVVTGYTTYVSVDTVEEIFHYNINPENISTTNKIFAVDNDTIFFDITSDQHKTIKGWIYPDTINQNLDFYYKYKYYNSYSYPGVYSGTTNTYSFNLFQIPYSLDQYSNYEINISPSEVIPFFANVDYYYYSYYNNQGELGDTRKTLLQFNGLNDTGNFRIIVNKNGILNR